MRKLKTDRSIIPYILLGIITLGIYELWFLHHMIKDVNEICREDGNKTPGLLVLILLSLVTCGFYALFWWYRVADMLDRASRRVGVSVEITGSKMLICMLLGSFVCGIVSLVGLHWLFESVNLLAVDYNTKLYTASAPEAAEN
jgi:hypothetical protein